MKVKGINVGKLERITAGRVTTGRSGGPGASASAAPKDDVEVSAGGRLFGMAGEAAQSAPDIRQERIQPIRDSLANGHYDVDSLKIADKLLRQVLLERKRSL